MASIEIVLAMLIAVLASGYITRMLPFSLPLPLVQIGLGATIAAVSGEGVKLDPHLFFLLFLPPLLFLDGWRIPKVGLFRDKAVIIELALGLVVFTMLAVGLLVHWMIPSMPLGVAFALAAIISPTDPIAVSSIASRVPIPKRMLHILEGESLLNDATGLVCFRFAVAAVMTGGFSLASASLTFVWLVLAGIGIGVVFTVLVNRVHAWLTRHFGEESGAPILISLLIPFGAYQLAELVHASGILAAVAAGITMSFVELSGRALATTRVQRAAVWDTVQFALNGVIFVLLGEQLPGILRDAAASVEQAERVNQWWLAAYALAISAALIVMRFAWVWVSLRITIYKARRRGEAVTRPRWRVIAAISVAGVRGAITLAGVLTLPLLLPDGSVFPARDLVIFLATSVILVSLVVASVALPRLLVGLTLPDEGDEAREIDMARHAAGVAAIAAIDRAQNSLPEAAANPDVYINAAARVMALYEHRITHDGSSGIDAAELRLADHAERSLRIAGVQAERRVIFEMARARTISDETARMLVRELDLLESRYR